MKLPRLMKHLTWLFIISMLVLFVSPVIAQDETKSDEAIPKGKEPWSFETLRLGYEIGKFSDYIFLPERQSYGGSLELTFNNKHFVTVIAGVSNYQGDKSHYQYESNGAYVIAGIDRNMLKKKVNDALTAGLRIGYASFSHEMTNITFDAGRWGDYPFSIPKEDGYALWTELSVGIKAELFKNFYIGWSVQARLLINSNYDNFEPIDIPGYGKTGNSLRLAARYSIYYAIPFRK